MEKIPTNVTMSSYGEGKLKRFSSAHNEEKVMKCKFCEYASYSAQTLRRHLRTHADRSNKCNQCDYASYDVSNLKTHLKTHNINVEKSNKCNQCGFASASASPSTLKRHLMTHGGEKLNNTITDGGSTAPLYC